MVIVSYGMDRNGIARHDGALREPRKAPAGIRYRSMLMLISIRVPVHQEKLLDKSITLVILIA